MLRVENRDMAGYISEVFGSFQGEGPHIGERHVFVRFSGCGLGCAYCDTRDAAGLSGVARVERGPGLGELMLPNPLSVDAVVDAVMAQESFPGFNSFVSVTGGEPLEQPEFLRELTGALGGRFRVLLETNGTLAAELSWVRDGLDVVSMDIKLPSASGLGPLWDRHAEFIGAAAGMELVVKVVVSPGTTPEEVAMAAGLAANHQRGAAFVIQPVTGKGGVHGVTGDMLLSFYTEARGRIKDVRVIPQAHKILGVR